MVSCSNLICSRASFEQLLWSFEQLPWSFEQVAWCFKHLPKIGIIMSWIWISPNLFVLFEDSDNLFSEYPHSSLSGIKQTLVWKIPVAVESLVDLRPNNVRNFEENESESSCTCPPWTLEYISNIPAEKWMFRNFLLEKAQK